MRLKSVLFSLLALFLMGEAAAQSSSAYSRFGIGDAEYSYFARSAGIGGLGVSTAEPDFLNHINPAAWYLLNRTRFETGINFNGIFLSASGASNYYGDAQFGGFTFSFPVSQIYGVGAAAGILPYSNISYNSVEIVENSPVTGGAYENEFEGSGGLSKLFAGLSYMTPANIVVGATIDYYFGNLNYYTRLNFRGGGNNNAEYTKNFSPRGVGTTIGLLSPDLSSVINTKGITDVRAGLSYTLLSTLTTDTSYISSTLVNTDTLSSGTGQMKVPFRLNGGVSMRLNSRYLISLDYAYQPWSQYEFEGISSGNLRDASKLSAGLEYRPVRTLGASFWEQIIWRAGLSFEQTQYVVNGTGINQYSAAGGFSLPISTENTLDVSLQYSRRGSNEANLYTENILRLNVTVNLGDIWFTRYEK